MLKTNTAPQLSLLSRVLPNSLLESLILKLPFNKIEKGIVNLNLYGQAYRFQGQQEGHHAELTVVNPFRASWLIKTQGELGFAQAYYEGAIATSSLYELLYVGYDNREVFSDLLSNKSLNLLDLWQHRKNRNSLHNSRQNISYHYDLGNNFYRLWLDETMSYSSGIFNSKSETLAESQHNK